MTFLLFIISLAVGPYGYTNEPQRLTQIINELEGVTQDAPHFSSKWKVLCPQRWVFDTNLTTERINKLVRLVALHGIKRVEHINSSVALAIYARLKNEAITISCDDPTISNAVATSDNWLPANPWGSLTDLKNYWHFKEKKSTSLGKLLFDLSLDQEKAKYTTTSIQSAVFHELLHIARIDNLPVEIHNSFNEEKSKDVVYACEEYAFKVRGVLRAEQACLVCAMADVRGTRTVINWQDNKRISIAQNLCSPNT